MDEAKARAEEEVRDYNPAHCLGCYNRGAMLSEGEKCDCGCHTALRGNHYDMNRQRCFVASCKDCKISDLQSKIKALEEATLAMRNLADSRLEKIQSLEDELVKEKGEWKEIGDMKLKIQSLEDALKIAREALLPRD